MFIIENTNNIALSKNKKLLNTILIFILGVSLGILSKWLDSLLSYDSILFHRFIETIDLGNILSELPIWILIGTAISVFSKSPKRASLNVFLFFLGMNISYHMYTVYILGFNPQSYMMIWYSITLISPLMAQLCWYAKQNSKFSSILRVIIFTTMMVFAFYVGWIYISLGRIVNTLFLIIVVAILWKNPKETLTNLLYALVCRIVLGLMFYI
ncbi:hypothetical protein [Paraclostridium sordellii]|uniref:hypothetical protein n=1 Tax=Paraclostridium sordellii TaxID=1505 RepID=UPI0005E93CBE|nr:hypothetical protein [Paeniclostridium sordellii]CEN87077.1 Uncharacterised protein [[Clostridium] sordellii] [Paeniclostridium sordellii]